jgi:hypothetical protein
MKEQSVYFQSVYSQSLHGAIIYLNPAQARIFDYTTVEVASVERCPLDAAVREQAVEIRISYEDAMVEQNLIEC